MFLSPFISLADLSEVIVKSNELAWSWPTFKNTIGTMSMTLLSSVMKPTTMKMVKTPILKDLEFFLMSD
jgi:hypothetical protein